MPDPRPERPDADDYLNSNDTIDYDHPLVEEVAEQLTYGLRDNLSKAKAIFEYVRDQILHSFRIEATTITIKASEVLDKGHGMSYSKAHLLAALMRANKIPAGFCYQIKRDDIDDENLVVHGFNAVFIEELNRWIKLDASLHDDDTLGSDLLRITTSLAVDPTKGEEDDNIVYQNPSKRILKVMNHYDTLEELKDNLPTRF